MVHAAYIDGETDTVVVLNLDTFESLDTGAVSAVDPGIAGYEAIRPLYEGFDGLFVAFSQDGSSVTVRRVLPAGPCLDVTKPLYDAAAVGPMSMAIHPQGVFLPGENDFPQDALTGEMSVLFMDAAGSYRMLSVVRDDSNPCSPEYIGGPSLQLGTQYYPDTVHLDTAYNRVFVSYKPPPPPEGEEEIVVVPEFAYRYRWGY